MNKIGNFIFKYKVVLTIVLLLIVSFMIYKFVLADEDIYENQIYINNSEVNIVDGSENFDSDDTAGNDSSNNNKIVRSFDQVTYNISYTLAYKTDSTLTEEEKTLDVTRDVIIDVLVPKSMYMKVSDGDIVNELTPQKNGDNNTMIVNDNYYYYQIIKRDCHIAETNNAEIILSKINGKNGDTISPIIRLREATEQVETINENTNVSSIGKINVDDVTISAKEKYAVKLFQGVKKEESENINTMPLGIMIYIPNDSQKGIKGVQIPSEARFNLNILSSISSSLIEVSDNPITDYSSDSQYVVSELPYSYSTNNNGRAGIENSSLNQDRSSAFEIKFTDLVFDENTKFINLSENEMVYYISTKLFLFKSKRTDKNNIIYSISTDAPVSNTISDYLDNYVPFVGDYVSKIDFFNKRVDDELSFVESGKAVYNYNEEFYIQNTINYGNLKGDTLQNGFTNYIKIDNTAIKLEKTENASDELLDYYIQISGRDTSDYNATVQYGLGSWEPSNFKLSDNRPSYCPSNISSLSKDDLMNMYGGPCIEDNNIQWVNSIQEAKDSGKENNIILFKLNISGQYDTGVQTIVRLKAKTVKNYSNIGNTFAIISRGNTIYNSQRYYLSEIANNSVSNHASDMRYSKTKYDSNYNITENNSTIVNNNSMTNIGNTILVSAFKSSINSIELHDAYNSTDKTTFYSGMTDPIEFVINPIIYKSDPESIIAGATISVYLPETLEIYKKFGDKAYNESTSGNVVTIDGVNYKVYNYDYSEDEISTSGIIPVLKVHAYISIAVQDNTATNVIARISGKMKTSENSSVIYEDIVPIGQRTKTVNLNLKNTKIINSIGKISDLYIEQDGSYQYNMRSTNNSGTSSNLSLLYILPYDGDGIGKGSKFTGDVSVSIVGSLPAGYTAMYTSDNAKVLLNNELNNPTSTNWSEWNNINDPLENVTAIKIISTQNIPNSGYFGSEDGITLDIKTSGNKESEKYYNNFYIIKSGDSCDGDNCTDSNKITSYSSNISQVSVYDRVISGYAFEDFNYNGFYEKNESRLKNVVVDLYKLNTQVFEPNNPAAYISDADTKISDEDSVTDNDGFYKFEGLSAGNYYVKYTFDCEKYTVTEKNKTDAASEGDASNKDSDAQIVESNNNVCYAVSNILTLNNENVEYNNIDIGLRLRQDFDIKIRKYITNVKVKTNGNVVNNYDYNNESKVRIEVKNLKNTSFTVTYGIEIENSKYFPGTIGNIVESIPEGMTFNPKLAENDGWYESDGYLYYSYLNKTIIMPGQKYHLNIVLDLQTNTAGDYINLVAANNLKINPVITDFLEIPDDPTIEVQNVGGDQ